jgi:hypothetical protein
MEFEVRDKYVDAIIVDIVDVTIVGTAIIAIIACAWDLSVNLLQPNHHFSGSSLTTYTLLVASCLSLFF